MKIKQFIINKASSIDNICRMTFDIGMIKSFIIDENFTCFLNKIYDNILINEKEIEHIREFIYKKRE